MGWIALKRSPSCRYACRPETAGTGSAVRSGWVEVRTLFGIGPSGVSEVPMV